MAILNYTTQVPIEKTASEIHALLVKAGASAVMNEYDRGVLVSVSFRIKTKHGIVSYKLPANVRGVLVAMHASKKVPKTKCNMDQAARVGWRIVKDWCAAQLAIVQADMAEPAEVFLAYAITKQGRTLYQSFDAGGCQPLGLPYMGDDVPQPC